jgi:LPXTG-motif cell wall-anchored protein
MNYPIKISLFNRGAIAAFLMSVVAIGSWAQDTTITTTQKGMPSYETEVKNAEVVYVEGNDLVLKLENGRVEHLVVPDRDEFTIDGKVVSVHELRAGTKLTQTVTTITTPHYVNTVRTIEGKVWHVNPPNTVILRLPDNTNQMYTIPSHASFVIDGQQKTAFDLRKGMNIKATIVTDDEHTVIERNKFAFGQAPKPETPREVGLLLFLEPRQPETTMASAEPLTELPATGTKMPLLGIAGIFSIATALGLRITRRRFAL